MSAKGMKQRVIGAAGILLLGIVGCQGRESVGVTQAKLVDGPSFRLTPSTNTVTPGQPFHLTIEALDGEGNVNADFAGTLHFTSSDEEAIVPADRAMSAVTHGVLQVFNETSLHTTGTQTITVTDADNTEITGSAEVEVHSAGLNFVVEAATSAVSGDILSVTVKSNYSDDTPRTNYVGTIHFTSSDANAILPQNYTFTSNDEGAHTFSVQLLQAGSQSITVVDTQDANATKTVEIEVSSGPASHFNIQTSSNSINAGDLLHVYVTVLDANNNPVSDYTGTLVFTSSDPHATLPNPTTFGENQSSISLFYSTRLAKAGNQTVTVSDQSTGTITGNTSVAVARGEAAKLGVSAASVNVEKDSTFDMTVRVEDNYGNPVTDYTGTILLSSTDSMASFPTSYELQTEDEGQHVFAVSLHSPGSFIMYADIAGETLTRGSLNLQVSLPQASGPHIVITLWENPLLPGVPSHLLVSAVDAEGQPLSNYSGTIHFTSDDPTAYLPGNHTFSPLYPSVWLYNSFSFPNGGLKTITATDTQDSSMQGAVQIFIGGGET